MTYSVVFTPTAQKQFAKAGDSRLRERIARAIEHLAAAPAVGKPLQAELKGLFSYRVGDYRIIYAFFPRKNELVISHISHRREAYR